MNGPKSLSASVGNVLYQLEVAKPQNGEVPLPYSWPRPEDASVPRRALRRTTDIEVSLASPP